jgi:hypothetical protein
MKKIINIFLLAGNEHIYIYTILPWEGKDKLLMGIACLNKSHAEIL